MHGRLGLVGLILVAMGATGACFDFGSKLSQGDEKKDPTDPTNVPTGPGIGSMCAKDSECRKGLTCDAPTKICQVIRQGIPGAFCVLSGECLPGNYCSPLGVCAESGKTPDGGGCSGEGDCQSGFLCAVTGIYGTCVKEGMGDVDKACLQTNECRGGLICARGKCQPLRKVESWSGALCPDEESTGKAMFRVPRATATPNDDFYALPFPNDIRRKDGKLDLARHPRPGLQLLPIDPVDMYLKTMEEDKTGFGTNPTTYFRFTRPPNFGSLDQPGAVAYYDITPGSPGYGLRVGHSWFISTAVERYVCPRNVKVRPPNWGSPLRPGNTYAVVLGKGITSNGTDGMPSPFVRDADFDAMLSATMPTDADLAAAWKSYAPLRAFLGDAKAESKPKADDILVAAVFTTDKVDEPVGRLRAAVLAAPAPVAKGLVKCAPGVMSPCAGGMSEVGEGRGCPADSDPAFDEYQGTISIPGFQKGTVPFDLTGGGIDDMPSVQRTEDVCVSLTVPKGAAPAGGWPVVLYGHGTGGSYRSHVVTGIAADFAKGMADMGLNVPTAMLGYDGVLHGPRKAGSTKPASELVFNYLNPRAARDNPLQAAADLFALTRALGSGAVDDVKIDKSKIALYGHSQGGNAGALAAAYETGFSVVVLSGTGGGLIPSLLTKTKPVSVAAALGVVLSDFAVGEAHPVLNLLQMYFDRSDPVNFARKIVQDPPMGKKAVNLLHLMGLDDTYAPQKTQEYFGAAAGLQVVAPVVAKPAEYLLAAYTGMVPVIGNVTVGADPAVTAVQLQYKPAAYDGHFVSTQNAAARLALQRMILSTFRDGKAIAAP